MKASSIAGHENTFHASGLDNSGKKFILTEGDYAIKGSTKKVHLVDCVRENKDKSFYYEEVTTKRKIALHFTMGYLKGDIDTLTKQHVSVPFVLARNGYIYNLFSSKFWSYHLGAKAIGGNTAMSKECIGIEVSNIGPLKKIGNNLVTTYRDTDIYCSLDETQYYTKLPTKYRGYEYYATFTNAQYEALSKLILFLAGKYNIPLQFLPENKRYGVLSEKEFVGFTGIVSHVNCRLDKCDIGPAFDWNKLIQLTKL